MAGAESTDAELLGGGIDSFAAFYRRQEDPILGFFLRRTGQPEVAADLTAECFARALEGRGNFDPALGDARGWLFGIARHVLARSLDRGRVENETRLRLGMEPLVLDDADITRINELNGAPAMAALNNLPQEQIAAVTGRVIEDRDYAELAARLQCSESVVRQRVSRGLKTLRSALEGSG
ncbi:MAG TPA: RNA polymerase sigma factor [Baekduia sp.]|nr:RNA polymerase sigma factor [Baekduia sp.]